jgi:hypothetical protein
LWASSVVVVNWDKVNVILPLPGNGSFSGYAWKRWKLSFENFEPKISKSKVEWLIGIRGITLS